MTTAKELAAATQAQRLAEGYRKRFEAAAMGADSADDVVCSLARTLLRRASGSPQPEPAPIPADTRAVVREALGRALTCQIDAAARAHINDALAAIVAAPAEKVVGYAAMAGVMHVTALLLYKTPREARDFNPAARIVRLIAEPGQ